MKYLIKNTFYRATKFINFGAIVLVFATVCGLSTVPVHAQGNPTNRSERIDVPVTPTNSVLYEIGDGITLRVPKILFPDSMIPKDPRQIITTDRLAMTFMYPDMVLGSYPSAMTSIFERKEGQPVPKPDHFPVYIKWIFHSHQVVGSDAEENGSRGLDWRPLTYLKFLEVSVRNNGREHDFRGLPDAKITLIDSKYKGLREVKEPVTDKAYVERAEKDWRANGWKGEEGAYYVEGIGSPYELYMDCQAPSSLKCTAYVYIRSNHFQYQMIFPPNQVDHADQLIRTVNKMIGGWIQNQLPQPHPILKGEQK